MIEGDTVEPGQHLISIDEKQIRPRYNNAVSQVKSSEANLRKVQSQRDRTKSLFSQKLISKQVKLILVEKHFFQLYRDYTPDEVDIFLKKNNFRLLKKFTFPLLYFQDNIYIKK